MVIMNSWFSSMSCGCSAQWDLASVMALVTPTVHHLQPPHHAVSCKDGPSKLQLPKYLPVLTTLVDNYISKMKDCQV